MLSLGLGFTGFGEGLGFRAQGCRVLGGLGGLGVLGSSGRRVSESATAACASRPQARLGSRASPNSSNENGSPVPLSVCSQALSYLIGPLDILPPPPPV